MALDARHPDTAVSCITPIAVRHARRHIGSFIEQVSNRHRLYSVLDYRSPLEFEVGHAPPTVTVAAAMGFQGMGNLQGIDFRAR